MTQHSLYNSFGVRILSGTFEECAAEADQQVSMGTLSPGWFYIQAQGPHRTGAVQ